MSHKFKKSLGQNFLINNDIIKSIVSFLGAETKTVIEIGPGDGGLTQELLKMGFEVYSVEIDKDLYKNLENKFRNYKNFHLLKEDIIRLDIDKLISTIMKDEVPRQYTLIGNLPYNISKRIIKKFLEEEIQPIEMIFMVQKEVADDYVSLPPKAKFLANYIQIFSNARYLMDVPKENFIPMPKVDGAIVRFQINTKYQVENYKKLIKFLRQGFSSPRKTLTNVLGTYDKETIIHFLIDNNLSDKARASELTFTNWTNLFKILKDN